MQIKMLVCTLFMIPHYFCIIIIIITSGSSLFSTNLWRQNKI